MIIKILIILGILALIYFSLGLLITVGLWFLESKNPFKFIFLMIIILVITIICIGCATEGPVFPGEKGKRPKTIKNYKK